VSGADESQAGNGVSSTSADPRDGISMLGVTKQFPMARQDPLLAVDNIDFHVANGEFVGLIGPSGSGKSTILRMAASLESPTSGVVIVNGRAPAELAEAHRLGVAFQDHALLPWLTTWNNIALPFRVSGVAPDKERIASLIELVGLTGFENARPKQLSGGMSQRVAIARALVLKPDVLLLDEPFGALDAVTRRRMNLELQDIWEQQAITTLLVTHSVDEALFLADRVIVLSARPGRIKVVQDVPFARPRGRELLVEPKFHELVDQLTLALDEEQPSEEHLAG
jgi:NitT/TauT family transport system ATP-binding protein